jgi:hypothetical protein
VNAARREIVRLGLHLRDTKQGELSDGANAALAVLEKWFKAGASSDLKSNGAELATRLSTFFRFVATPLALRYGGGESGLARFLKDTARRIAADPKAAFDEEECRFISTIIEAAWLEAGPASGADARGRSGRNPGSAQTLGWFESLDGFGSLDPAGDLKQPDLSCLDGQTIHSQAAQSYTQFVPLHDVDSAQSICPIGHSDRPDGRARSSTMTLWGAAKLHAAPLSREGVERIAMERSVLSK